MSSPLDLGPPVTPSPALVACDQLDAQHKHVVLNDEPNDGMDRSWDFVVDTRRPADTWYDEDGHAVSFADGIARDRYARPIPLDYMQLQPGYRGRPTLRPLQEPFAPVDPPNADEDLDQTWAGGMVHTRSSRAHYALPHLGTPRPDGQVVFIHPEPIHERCGAAFWLMACVGVTRRRRWTGCRRKSCSRDECRAVAGWRSSRAALDLIEPFPLDADVLHLVFTGPPAYQTALTDPRKLKASLEAVQRVIRGVLDPLLGTGKRDLFPAISTLHPEGSARSWFPHWDVFVMLARVERVKIPGQRGYNMLRAVPVPVRNLEAVKASMHAAWGLEVATLVGADAKVIPPHLKRYPRRTSRQRDALAAAIRTDVRAFAGWGHVPLTSMRGWGALAPTHRAKLRGMLGVQPRPQADPGSLFVAEPLDRRLKIIETIEEEQHYARVPRRPDLPSPDGPTLGAEEYVWHLHRVDRQDRRCPCSNCKPIDRLLDRTDPDRVPPSTRRACMERWRYLAAVHEHDPDAGALWATPGLYDAWKKVQGTNGTAPTRPPWDLPDGERRASVREQWAAYRSALDEVIALLDAEGSWVGHRDGSARARLRAYSAPTTCDMPDGSTDFVMLLDLRKRIPPPEIPPMPRCPPDANPLEHLAALAPDYDPTCPLG